MEEQEALRAAASGAGVRNVLGDACIRCVTGDDREIAAIAAWAERHAAELEATLWALERGSGRRSGPIRFHDELRRHRWVTDDGVPRVTDAGTLAREALNRYISADRTAETRDFLHASAAIDGSSRVLDVGCSSGRMLLGLADRGPRRMAGVDNDLFALHLAALGARSRGYAARWYCASALDLPFPGGAFTHALSFVTLNYVPVRAALLELARVLEDGGQLILTLEGHGYWLRQFRRGGSARRLQLLLRELPGNVALPFVDWQKNAFFRRVAPHAVLSRGGIARMLAEAGFTLERIEVLRRERGAPWLIGVAARKRRRR